MKKSKRLVLVTGCARSGTLYTSKIFREVGLKVRHELRLKGKGTVDA